METDPRHRHRRRRNGRLDGGGRACQDASAPQQRRITLVESEEIGTVGVGEVDHPADPAVQPPARNRRGRIRPRDQRHLQARHRVRRLAAARAQLLPQFRACSAPISSTGVSFIQYWLRWAQSGGGDPDQLRFSAEAEAARLGKFGRTPPSAGGGQPNVNYAFQFDASTYAAYLRRYSERRGVVRREGKVVNVRQNGETGYIEAVEMADGSSVARRLLHRLLGLPRAAHRGGLRSRVRGLEPLAAERPRRRGARRADGGPDALHRSPRAREAGWQWRIPLQHRTGNGYVFCSEYISDDEASRELLELARSGPRSPSPKVLRFKAGRRRASWVKNCLALGLVERLSRAAGIDQHSPRSRRRSTKFLDYFPDRNPDPILIDRFNEEMQLPVRDHPRLHHRPLQGDRARRHGVLALLQAHEHPGLARREARAVRARGEVKPRLGGHLQRGELVCDPLRSGDRAAGHHPLADAMSEDDLELTLSRIRSAIKQRVDGAAVARRLHRAAAAPRSRPTTAA